MLIYFFAGMVIGALLCWLAFSYIRRKENETIERALNGLLNDKYYLKMDADLKIYI
ncbi:hypothetical protein [Clostridium luticellarii]|uniref:Uncharacterized protein n=1 Tax=Clostridium luticellarii TaxID=1691940 RepID=A0A2T0BQF8_9CLOT|nr:hypothetical protein [Clostridium luticellarii]MCI1969380.1 hypothetical protein [Clostridium luticellarii]PRR86109.1 hypothetical protein CLLU_09410 [Clostridium luticellarii]